MWGTYTIRMNLQNRMRLRDRNHGCQERWGRLGEGTVRELETDVYKLLYLKWITKNNNNNK